MLSPIVRRINNQAQTTEMSMVLSGKMLDTRTSPRRRKIKVVKNVLPVYKPQQAPINVGVYPPELSTHFQADSQVSNLLMSKETLIRAVRHKNEQSAKEKEVVLSPQKEHGTKSFSNFLR